MKVGRSVPVRSGLLSSGATGPPISANPSSISPHELEPDVHAHLHRPWFDDYADDLGLHVLRRCRDSSSILNSPMSVRTWTRNAKCATAGYAIRVMRRSHKPEIHRRNRRFLLRRCIRDGCNGPTGAGEAFQPDKAFFRTGSRRAKMPAAFNLCVFCGVPDYFTATTTRLRASFSNPLKTSFTSMR